MSRLLLSMLLPLNTQCAVVAQLIDRQALKYYPAAVCLNVRCVSEWVGNFKNYVRWLCLFCRENQLF